LVRRKGHHGHGTVKHDKKKTKVQNDVTFAALLRPLVAVPKRPVPRVTLQSAPLAHLEYTEELRVKNEALQRFWQHFKLPGKPEPVIASPLPRYYRTTSKRRTVYRSSLLYLLLEEGKLSVQKKKFVVSPLEPRSHSRLYSFLQGKISEPPFKLVATHLNYLIIRGNYAEQAVIFNVDTLNGPLVRKLKIIADHLQKFDSSVTSAYIYPDPSCSDYYLEERQPSDILQFKKLFGKNHLSVTHHDVRYFFHPTSFSQVNESMVPVMLEEARQLLKPSCHESLIDLYCGYGLFSHYLAPGYKKVLGVEGEGPSVRSAMSNKKLNPASRKTRFIASRITDRSVEDRLPPPDGSPETILLDPPRKGPSDGVIGALCRRLPHKVLHIHCGVDQIPASMTQWRKGGFNVERIVPLDMFPGSANLEIMILFSPTGR